MSVNWQIKIDLVSLILVVLVVVSAFFTAEKMKEVYSEVRDVYERLSAINDRLKEIEYRGEMWKSLNFTDCEVIRCSRIIEYKDMAFCVRC